jgi:hypothetical protein
MTATPGLRLPRFYSYYKSPVKMVETPDGGMAAWRLSKDTGGWLPANHLIDDVLFAVGGEVDVLPREDFVQRTERERARYLRGDGPVFALYEAVKALVETAESERRPLTPEERALVQGIRRRTFRMFEEKLQREGDPAADPSLAD